MKFVQLLISNRARKILPLITELANLDSNLEIETKDERKKEHLALLYLRLLPKLENFIECVKDEQREISLDVK